MRETYMRQVKKHLHVGPRRKREILRDLEEIFDSALEHGELAGQVILRLGPPEAYARSLGSQLLSKGHVTIRRGLTVAIPVLLGLAALVLYGISQMWGIPAQAIGFAQGTTGIQLQGGLDGRCLLLCVAGVAFVVAAVQAVRLGRKR
jgi:hypothetical protein